MKRLAIVIGLVAACSSGQKKPTTGAGSGSAIYAKKLVLGWGFQNNAGKTDVFLQTTDEKGAQVSYPLGTFDGTCKSISPAAEMKAITGVACTGIELHAVVQDPDVVILKMRTDTGGTPDPMAREEIQRVKIPGGAAVEAST
jgi:hypothetical protein